MVTLQGARKDAMSKQGVRWRNKPSTSGMTAERMVLGGYMIVDIAYVVFHIQSLDYSGLLGLVTLG